MTAVIESPAPARTSRPSLAGAALSGLLAGAVALGVGELVSSFARGLPSPLDAVGSEFIDRTPGWLKELAVDWFGTNDKRALRIGMLGVIALLALGLGMVASRRRAAAAVGFGAFGLLGAAAALHRPGADLADAVAPLLAAAAGAVALRVLLARLDPGPRPSADAGAEDEARPDDQGPGRGLELTLATTDRKASVDRRGFLVTSAIAGGVAAVTAASGRRLRHRFDVAASRDALALPPPASPASVPPPGVEVGVDGVVPFVTPNDRFYRIDTALAVPQVKAESYRLRVHGLVERELGLSFADLARRPLIERHVTLTCVSNEVGGDLISNARWLGVPLRDILNEAGVRDGADQLKATSVDGWTCGTPVAALLDGRDAMLALGMNGEPLPVEHGFPVRMVVPGLYGYVSACKWVVDLELTRFADFDAYWVRRGWAQEAPVKTQSRIDTPRPFARLRPGPTAVAGVAWAQHRGIGEVEVRVDGGEWQPARLGDELSADTWRQWVLPWDATPGRHSLEVRATDATGATQPEERVPPIPDGATGWHSVVVTVTDA